MEKKLVKLLKRVNVDFINPHKKPKKSSERSRYVTVRQVIDWAIANQLDLCPAFQRGVAATIEWCVKFLQSIFKGKTGPALHFRILEKGSKFLYQVIDGLQRIRALLLFHKDKQALWIDVGEVGEARQLELKTKSQIHDMPNGHAILDRFYNAKLLVTFHANLTNEEAAEKFDIVNNNTDLNPEERRECHLGIISQWVRESAGFVEDFISQSVEDSDTAGINIEKRLSVFNYMQVKRGRMVHNDILAKCLLLTKDHLTYDDGMFKFKVNHKRLMDLYTSDLTKDTRENQAELKIYTDVLEQHMSIVEKWIKSSGAKQFHTDTCADVLTLFQLTFALEKEYGTNMKVDFPKFAKNLWVHLNELREGNPKGFPARLPGDKTLYMRLRNSADPTLMAQKLALIMLMIGSVGITTRLKKKDRFFSRAQTLKRWVQVGGIDEITGEKLEFLQAEGGHRFPARDGGDNSDKNLIVVSKAINVEMGSTPAHTFKKMWQARQRRGTKKS